MRRAVREGKFSCKFKVHGTHLLLKRKCGADLTPANYLAGLKIASGGSFKLDVHGMVVYTMCISYVGTFEIFELLFLRHS